MNTASYKLDFRIETDQQKATIRKIMIARLKSLSAVDRAQKSANLVQNVAKTVAWKEAKSALLFYPLETETDIRPLLVEREKSIFLPRVTQPGLAIHRFDGAESLRRSGYGILEPDPGKSQTASIAEIDLVVVPGLAFDPTTGVRLGRGGGYYDRLLAQADFHGFKLAVCFDFQIQTDLPSEAHDQMMDQVVSA